MQIDISIIEKYIHNKSRISHCVSTAKMMSSYASYYSIDPENAYYCGLYHDIGKEVSVDESLIYVEDFQKRGLIVIENLELKKNYPSLLHGIVSAEILIRTYGLENIDCINAISNHTLGGKGLSRLSKFLYISDFADPLRKCSDSEKVYKALIQDKKFDYAYYLTYFYKLKHLLETKKVIVSDTIDGYNESVAIVS